MSRRAARLSVSKLRSEYKVREWSRIISENDYVAVLQLTRGVNWGRSNVKHRLKGIGIGSEREGVDIDIDTENCVDVKFAVPRVAREGALRTRYVGMGELFRAAPSAVVYGNDIAGVCTTIERADTMGVATLIGGKFRDQLIHQRQWKTVLGTDEKTTLAQLLQAVSSGSPKLVKTMEAGNSGLVNVIDKGDRAKPLMRLLNEHSKSGAEAESG